MMSKADIVKGHGVLSAHDEQVALVKEELNGICDVLENSKAACEITHYHSINPELFLSVPFAKRHGSAVGYVHFLPETVENSIKLPRFAKKLFYKYMLAFYRSMDYLVTVNPYFIDVLEKYGIAREKVTYIPNFVSDTEFYPQDRKQQKEIRRFYQLEEDTFTVLCVGQLQKRKGVLEFVRTAQQMPDVQFVWAGGFSFGKISDGYQEIKEMMKHLPKNVRFLGMVDREKMNDIYNMADVMFLPSFEELFPMTILESMNCAIPILVRDLDIYKPILFDYALKGESQEDFFHILSKLKTDSTFYLEASHAAFAGHEYYSRQHVGKMWKEFYANVLYRQGNRLPAARNTSPKKIITHPGTP